MSPTTRVDRREQIVEVATRLFSRRGFRGTTLDDIAAEIGFTKPAIYYWFDSKEAILFEIHDRIVRGSLERVAQIRANPGRAADQLRQSLLSHVETLLDNRAANEVFSRIQHELSPPRLRTIRRRDGEYESLLREIYAEGVRDGSLRPLDPQVAVGAMLGAVNSMYRWYRPQDGLTSADVVGQVLTILERGVHLGEEGHAGDDLQLDR